jgi:hypothetical protein
MTRIVRTSYRYKRPPKRKKPVTLEMPAVITAKRSRRLIRKKAAAEIRGQAPASGRSGAVQPSTPHEAARAVPAAIITVRRKTARIIPLDLPETPEEHQRRGDAADAMWRDLVRRVTGEERS